MKLAFSPLLLALPLGALVLSGCHSLSISPQSQQQAPFELQQEIGLSEASAATLEELRPPTTWLSSFDDPNLRHWVDQATGSNFDLLEAKARVEAAHQQRNATRSNLWPTLDLGLSGQRQKSTNADERYSNNVDLSADIAWELDLWGKLSDGRQASEFRWQAQQVQYQASRLSIAGLVSKGWYNVITEHQLTELFQERVTNLQANLDIILSGYRQGINDALDVYLAQSDLAGQKSTLEQQRAIEADAVRQLQLLLGQYPSGTLTSINPEQLSFSHLQSLDSDALSAQSVRYRYDLQSSYLELLASDRDLAVAHKDRFPSFRLTASGGDSSDSLHSLLDTSSLAWNLIGNLSQPLFAGGRLQALEAQQQAVVRQKEQQYLKALHTAFSEVEQAITNEHALIEQLTQVQAAKQYAEAAEELSFDEYRQGLQSYTAVLEAQRRAFTAQNTVISIHNQLRQNRINLFLALGGDYE